MSKKKKRKQARQKQAKQQLQAKVLGPPKKRQKHSESATPSVSASERILLVGEGNFSFARALTRLGAASVTATGYDSREDALLKYEDELTEVLDELDAAGATVLFGVDAADLLATLKRAGGKRRRGVRDLRFDTIFWNFPHAGAGIKNQAVNIQCNQRLLSAFFQQCLEVLQTPHGQVKVALKRGEPYDSWGITSLAHHATGGRLRLRTEGRFAPDDWPGYTHRRSIGFKAGTSAAHNEELQKGCRMYTFGLA